MTKDAALHNSVAPRITAEFMGAMIKGEAKPTDIMVALESVVFGAMISNEEIFGVNRRFSAEALDILATRVAERLAAHNAAQDRKDMEHG